MRELACEEIESVVGGNPVVGAVYALALGVGGNYAYESLGGKAGIDSMVSSAFSSFASGWSSISSNYCATYSLNNCYY